MSRNKGRGAQRHPHWQNPDAKGIPRPAQASGRALGSAPREGPPTPFVYFGLTGARGLQAQASRPSLTDRRLPLPGLPAHPASPHLSPRLQQSARAWRATRLRANPTASASAVRLGARGGGSSRNRRQCQGARGHVKKQGTRGATASPLAKSRCEGHSPPRTGLRSRPWKCSSGRASHSVRVLRPHGREGLTSSSV